MTIPSIQPAVDLAMAVLCGRGVDAPARRLWALFLEDIERTGLIRAEPESILWKEPNTLGRAPFAQVGGRVFDAGRGEHFDARMTIFVPCSHKIFAFEWRVKFALHCIGGPANVGPLVAAYLRSSLNTPHPDGEAALAETLLDSMGQQTNAWMPSDFDTFRSNFSKHLSEALAV